MQNSLINKDFENSIKRLRRMLPILTFSLLIGTYLISAIIMGIFHAQNAQNLGFTIAAFLVPLAIQTGRGTLVFFFQLNPAHLQGKYSFGIVAATLLLILSLVEAWFVLIPFGTTWIISVSTLLAIGWIIEIMVLKETIFATQLEMFSDKGKWEQVKQFYIDRAKLNQFLQELKNGNITIEVDQTTQQLEENKALSLLNEINQRLEGNELSPSENGQAAE